MYPISDYSHRLRLIEKCSDYGLFEYKPTLRCLLLIPFEQLTYVRKVRLALEVIRGGYYVYYLSKKEGFVGYCVVTPGGRRLKKSSKNDIVLGPYFIAPVYRGKGFAKELIKLTLEHCVYDYRYAYDWIHKNNVGSIRATETCGFEECGRLNVVGPFRCLIESNEGDNIIYRYTRK